MPAKKSHRGKDKHAKKLVAFGKNLRKLRESKGWSEEALAIKADLSPTTISNLENGQLNTTLATVFSLADALKIDSTELFKH